MIDTNELRRLTQAVSGWSNCNQVWLDQSEDVPAAVVGHIDEDGNTYPIATIDCDQYYAAHQSLPLAKFYAAANPAAISELLDRLEAAEKSDAESLAMYRKARDERDALRAEIERLQSNLSASAQAFVQLEAVAAEARRNDATAMSWISEAKHAIGYEGDMPGFIGALRELNDVRRRVPAKITVSQAPHSQYAKGWNDCMKAIKEESK